MPPEATTGWVSPGAASDLFRWNVDEKNGLIPPGTSGPKEHRQFNLPATWSPSKAPRYKVRAYHPGQAAPLDGFQYTRETKQVSPPGMPAPAHLTNLEVVPVPREPDYVPVPNDDEVDPVALIQQELAEGPGPQVGMGADSKMIANQFDPQLSWNDAVAACGPAAAVTFARAVGRTPTVKEALELAREFGWTPQGGMAGIASQQALMKKMGLDTEQLGADWTMARNETRRGRPVAFSTPGHYFVANDYDPTNDSFFVGNSGTAYKGGKDWMTIGEMEALGGQTQGMIRLKDSPVTPVSGSPERAVPQLQSNDVGASNPLWSSPEFVDATRWRSAQFGVDPYKARTDLMKGENRDYLESALGMARAGEIDEIVGTGADFDPIQGSIDFVRNRLGESRKQISQPQSVVDPILGILGAASIPFEPVAAAMRYGVGALAQVPHALAGEEVDWSPPAVWDRYQNEIPTPVQMAAEILTPVPPLGKLGKLGKWAKMLEKDGEASKVLRLGNNEVVEGMADWDIPTLKSGRTLGAHEDLDRLGKEAVQWSEGDRQAALETAGFTPGNVNDYMDADKFPKGWSPVPEYAGGKLGSSTDPKSLKVFNESDLVKGAPPTVIKQIDDDLWEEYMKTVDVEDFERGVPFVRRDSVELRDPPDLGSYNYANRKLGLDVKPPNPNELSKRLGFGYPTSNKNLLLMPSHIEQLQDPAKTDIIMDALVPDGDGGKKSELFYSLVDYLTGNSKYPEIPVLVDTTMGEIRPVRMANIWDPTQEARALKADVKVQELEATLTGLYEERKYIYDRIRKGKRSEKPMWEKDLKRVNDLIEQTKDERLRADAVLSYNPKTMETRRGFAPERVGKMDYWDETDVAVGHTVTENERYLNQKNWKPPEDELPNPVIFDRKSLMDARNKFIEVYGIDDGPWHFRNEMLKEFHDGYVAVSNALNEGAEAVILVPKTWARQRSSDGKTWTTVVRDYEIVPLEPDWRYPKVRPKETREPRDMGDTHKAWEAWRGKASDSTEYPPLVAGDNDVRTQAMPKYVPTGNESKLKLPERQSGKGTNWAARGRTSTAQPKRIAVVGSRSWDDQDAIKEYLSSLPSGTHIVSGGAKGADSLAELEARKLGLGTTVHRPDWSKGRSAGFDRNGTVVDDADVVVAFWDGKSKGTQDTMRKAYDQGKLVEIHYPDGKVVVWDPQEGTGYRPTSKLIAGNEELVKMLKSRYTTHLKRAASSVGKRLTEEEDDGEE
jgi:hypothetical protein